MSQAAVEKGVIILGLRSLNQLIPTLPAEVFVFGEVLADSLVKQPDKTISPYLFLREWFNLVESLTNLDMTGDFEQEVRQRLAIPLDQIGDIRHYAVAAASMVGGVTFKNRVVFFYRKEIAKQARLVCQP